MELNGVLEFSAFARAKSAELVGSDFVEGWPSPAEPHELGVQRREGRLRHARRAKKFATVAPIGLPREF
jgi:hypothetical protein